jgi:hypothetical protein
MRTLHAARFPSRPDRHATRSRVRPKMSATLRSRYWSDYQPLPSRRAAPPRSSDLAPQSPPDIAWLGRSRAEAPATGSGWDSLGPTAARRSGSSASELRPCRRPARRCCLLTMPSWSSLQTPHAPRSRLATVRSHSERLFKWSRSLRTDFTTTFTKCGAGVVWLTTTVSFLRGPQSHHIRFAFSRRVRYDKEAPARRCSTVRADFEDSFTRGGRRTSRSA